MSVDQPTESRSVRLNWLRIRRAPGIPDGFEFRCANKVVIVVGPNGSGKTTAAGAIESLLWPGNERSPDLAAAASFSLDRSVWQVEVDGTRTLVQRDGVDAILPLAVDAASRHRYRLPLHELLSDAQDGRDFATRILHESQGGYDLRAAGATLALATPGRRSGRPEQNALRTAREKLEVINTRQRDLADDYERLTELRAAIHAARQARARIASLEIAINRVGASSEYEQARIALDAYDPRMSRFTGDEPDRLDTLRQRMSAASDRMQQARSAIDSVKLVMERVLPRGPLPEALLTTLHHALDSLRSMEARLESGSRVAQCRAECDEARAALGVTALEEERLASVNLGGIAELDDFSRETEQLRAERAAFEAELAAKAENPRRDLSADTDADDGTLLTRIGALEAWLAAPAPEAAGQRWLTIVVVILALVATIAGVMLGTGGTRAGWMVAMAGAMLVVLAVITLVGGYAQARGRAPHVAAYLRHGGKPPSSWSSEAVQMILSTLRQSAAEAQLRAARSDRRATVRALITELDGRSIALETRRANLVKLLGVAPSTGPAALSWLTGRIARWRAARQALAGALALDVEDRRVREADRAAVVAHLTGCGFEPADGRTDTASLVGAVSALDERQQQFTAAKQTRDVQFTEFTAAHRELQQLQADRESFLESLGLAEAELHRLTEWKTELPSRTRAHDLASRTSARLERATAELRAAVSADDPLLHAAGWELDNWLEEARSEADSYDTLVAEVARIEARVDEARGGEAASQALFDMKQCEQVLEGARENDMERSVGAVLLDFLQRKTRDAQRPAVFHLARELFLRVTHGRWRLILDDSSEAAFRAIDTESDVGHALHELSSGTRVQLLLAVRLAFVELQEGDGPRLPLLLDETLGTSDEARAQSIIETILELAAASGRQLFYFTAQDDEAAKWRGVLQARGIAADIIDLAACRRLATPVATFTPVAALPERVPPEPDGLTHAEYGRELEVRAIPLDTDSVGATHLWHLTEDLELLHSLLVLHVDTWGKLESLVTNGGFELVPLLPRAYPRLRAAARALGEAHRLARVGRARRVDRQALVASGAISNTFMDAVTDLAAKFDGDGERLTAHLEAGRLKRFRASAAEELRNSLIESGHLATEPPLSPDEITVAAMAALTEEMREGLVTRRQLDRLVAAVLPPGVPGGELPTAHPGFARADTDAERTDSH